MEDLGSQQLNALAAVGELLEQVGIDYWLFGGWAVDFHAGSVTRAHDDIDLAIWLEDLPRITRLLELDGWQHVPSKDDDGGTGFERGAVRLELTFLVCDAEGNVYTPLNNGRADWPEDGFASDVRELHGVRSRVMAIAPLTLGKSFPRDDAEDATKDLADFTVLSRLTSKPARD